MMDFLFQQRKKSKPTPWFYTTEETQVKSPVLYCFAHAGGNAEDYLRWQSKLSDVIQMRAICIPGTGRRYKEEYIKNIDLLVTQIASAIDDNSPEQYYLFGHSMGGIIAFEVANRVSSHASGLIVSACAAPKDVPSKRVVEMSLLKDEEFIKKALFFGGLPDSLLDFPETSELIALRLKRDFQLISKYCYQERAPIKTPILSIVGSEDPHISSQLMREWESFTEKYIGHHTVTGNHFYFDKYPDLIVNIIKNTLALSPNAINERYSSVII
ncbi:alpha/beta fold hydrolase [Photorhabdus sp. P32]|uniref:thioesterase II family protein n=1 Tax=Photorhabdus sp. P32 TaxID=3117549 RepID=UPI00311AF973